MSMSAKNDFEILVDEQVQIALMEVGAIEPWFDEEVQEWIFARKKYPESCSGATRQEVIENYPLYLRQFIEQRLKGNLAPWIEKKTAGRGGRRAGAGRPRGRKTLSTRTIRIAADIAAWLKSDPRHLQQVRDLMTGHMP
jgi:hypothetical protein